MNLTPNIEREEDDTDPLKQMVKRLRCERDHLFFTRYFFKHRQIIKFKVNWHHVWIARVLQDVLDGKIKNLVINVPPGSSKTEMSAINLMARGLALNPMARFLHISYSDDLALLNSQTAREVVMSDEFQDLWPMEIADDAKAKKRWNIMVERTTKSGKTVKRKGGGVFAVSLGGQITGFRAGHMAAGFQGCIVIDDPLKPEDATSKTKRHAANRRLLNTVKSRKASPDTPIILIMQRLATDDPTGFIQQGNIGKKDDWVFVTIPALIDDEYVKTIPADLQAMVNSSERDEKGRFSYWPEKETLKDLLAMEQGSLTDKEGATVSRMVFAGQYQQAPVILGGNIIRGEWFPRFTITPKIIHRIIFADTAQKTKEANDYSVFQCWGMGEDGKIYLLDQIRGKWEAPELRQKAIDFWAKHKAVEGMGALRKFMVEDKASGTGLIQDLRCGERIPILAIQRNIDKLTRVMDVVHYIQSGYVCIPAVAAFANDFVDECESFTADDTHAHDDQIDPLCDAITDMLAEKPKSFFSTGKKRDV